MLSYRFYKFIEIGLNIASYLGVSPAIFDPKARLMVLSPRGLHLLRVHLIVIIFNVSFTLCQSIRFYFEGNLDNFNFNVTMTLVGCLGLENVVVITILYKESISMFNSLMIFLRKMNEIYMPFYCASIELNAILFEVAVIVISCGLGAMGLITAFFYILFPYSSFLIGSVIPKSVFAPLRLAVVYLFPQYINFVLVSNTGVMTIAFFVYGAVAVPWISKELRLDCRFYNTEKKLRTPEHLMVVYRSAQILQDKGLAIIQFLLVPTQSIVVDVILFSTFMIIKHGDQMSTTSFLMLTTWSIFAGIFWSGVLLVGGYLNWYGKKVLESWKYHHWETKQERRLMGRFRKSCKPLMIHMGRTFVIERLSVLRFFRGISRGIFRTLLALDV